MKHLFIYQKLEITPRSLQRAFYKMLKKVKVVEVRVSKHNKICFVFVLFF